MSKSPKRDVRITGAIKVIEEAADNRELGHTKNLSLGGLFLATQERWPIDTRKRIRIEYRFWRLSTLVRVAHHQRDGVGFQFEEHNPAFDSGIREIVNSLLADGAWYEAGQQLRAKISGPVVLDFQKEQIETHLKDLSLGGAYIELDLKAVIVNLTPAQPKSGDNITIYLPALGSDQERGVVGSRARVIHRDDMGFGVAFEEPSQEFLKTVEKLLRRGVAE